MRKKENIRQEINKNSKICIFGIGTLFSDCFEQIKLSLGKDPDYLSDNNSDKWGKYFFGVECIAPERLSNIDNVVVVIAIRNFSEIYEQLINLGIKRIHYLVYQRTYNSVKTIKSLNIEEAKKQQEPESLNDKWAFVTGASRGIGKKIASELAELGCNIIGHARKLSNLDSIKEFCTNHNVKFFPVAADFENLEEIETMLHLIMEKIGVPEIIYNNAGVSLPSKEIFSFSEEIYLKCYKINVLVPIKINSFFIPKMLSNNFGRIINISSSIQKRPWEVPYACSKAALDKYVSDIAPSVENNDVQISLMDPGWINTDMGGDIAPNDINSLYPGILIPVVSNLNFNGKWVTVQDYKNLKLNEACRTAKFIIH